MGSYINVEIYTKKKVPFRIPNASRYNQKKVERKAREKKHCNISKIKA
jgi:hypothetical protein